MFLIRMLRIFFVQVEEKQPDFGTFLREFERKRVFSLWLHPVMPILRYHQRHYLNQWDGLSQRKMRHWQLWFLELGCFHRWQHRFFLAFIVPWLQAMFPLVTAILSKAGRDNSDWGVCMSFMVIDPVWGSRFVATNWHWPGHENRRKTPRSKDERIDVQILCSGRIVSGLRTEHNFQHEAAAIDENSWRASQRLVHTCNLFVSTLQAYNAAILEASRRETEAISTIIFRYIYILYIVCDVLWSPTRDMWKAFMAEGRLAGDSVPS